MLDMTHESSIHNITDLMEHTISNAAKIGYVRAGIAGSRCHVYYVSRIWLPLQISYVVSHDDDSGATGHSFAAPF